MAFFKLVGQAGKLIAPPTRRTSRDPETGDSVMLALLGGVISMWRVPP